MEWKIETIGGVPQVVYKVPIDERVGPLLADLEFSRTFERLIIGPSPYPWTMFEAFAVALEKVGVSNPGNRISISGIPIRS